MKHETEEELIERVIEMRVKLALQDQELARLDRRVIAAREILAANIQKQLNKLDRAVVLLRIVRAEYSQEEVEAAAREALSLCAVARADISPVAHMNPRHSAQMLTIDLLEQELRDYL